MNRLQINVCAPALLWSMMLLGVGMQTRPAYARQPYPPGPQGEETCRPLPGAVDAQALLRRAARVVGVTRAGGRVLHVHAAEAVEMNYQSDRTYPPFFSMMRDADTWYDPGTGVERFEGSMTWPGGTYPVPPQLRTDDAAFVLQDTSFTPVPGAPSDHDVWAVLTSWLDADDVRPRESCFYRDYWRTVLSRPDQYRDQRLYLDPKTGFPVKLDREETHYLWGQLHVEYVYSIWRQIGDIFYPGATFKMVDGATEESQTNGRVELVEAAEAPSMAFPEGPYPEMDQTPGFLRADPPDTVRLADDFMLLRNRGYTEGAALVGDTVFVFDATQSQARAEQDAGWIEKAFPGDHPVAVVVSDLAWPHIGGVRYWVARGATIISHTASEAFLRSVVARRWTAEPDLLEQRRDAVRFTFEGIDAETDRAAGHVKLFPIDGIGSEGAIIAYLPDHHFLWAGDFIQRVDRPSAYTTEVWRAVQRQGFSPNRVAAQHLPVTAWTTIEGLQTDK